MAIQTKTIGELKDYRFYVPSYQRGYRWTEYEVTALLDDINEFSSEGEKRYCIQPLAVKQRTDGSFEVVDGQQRLTTIFIFMKIAEEKTDYTPFDLEFQTRHGSQTFLSDLSAKGNIDNSNIDYYHITTARKTINDWLDKQKNRYIAINRIFEKLMESVFFIWYEIPKTDDPIIVFTKVNLGKIPLTNAELIKALLLNKGNFAEETEKRQIEISLAWDRIECGLRNESFWYFLNEKEQSGTRIDFLFELLADEHNQTLNPPLSKGQNYFPFLVFAAQYRSAQNKEDFARGVWNEVEKLYSEFCDWYSDLNKYHIIGFLIASGTKIQEIFMFTRGTRKSAVMQALLDKAKKIVGVYDLQKIFYENKQSTRLKIRRLLLLFNIATLVCKSEKQYRFPFDVYKLGRWDIEHIHATADETNDADDSLWNLTLLDQSTNRSQKYACVEFKEKRNIILGRESKGLFVPLCTKNIFLKAYSSNLDEMNVWSGDDKKDYIAEMDKILNLFFSRGSQNE